MEGLLATFSLFNLPDNFFLPSMTGFPISDYQKSEKIILFRFNRSGTSLVFELLDPLNNKKYSKVYRVDIFKLNGFDDLETILEI